MQESEWLAARFEANRSHLQGVAFRMLGALDEAEDAVQETWLRLQRADAESIENLGGWLTTVVARISLDMLRTRKARREDTLDEGGEGASREDTSSPRYRRATPIAQGQDPEAEALLADSVGLALLVILETLTPAERLAFVLHDLFALPFDEIAPIIGRTPATTRQLASRARRRVRGTQAESSARAAHHTVRGGQQRRQQQQMVNAFLAAARGGDFNAMLTLLDPDVVLRSDPYTSPGGVGWELRGAEAVAKRSARGGARATQAALIDGQVGVVVAPQGKLVMVLRFTFNEEGKIAAIEAVADPAKLAAFEFAMLDDGFVS